MRLFIAIDFPENIKEIIKPLLSQYHGKTVPLEQIHLTLRFIGETDPKLFENIKKVLEKIESEPFEVKLKGTGCFPSTKRPRVLWLGLEKNSSLKSLKEKFDQALKLIGVPLEDRPFHPHVTLARIKKPNPRCVEDFLNKNLTFQSEPFTVDSFHLYSSQLKPEGAIHNKEMTVLLD